MKILPSYRQTEEFSFNYDDMLSQAIRAAWSVPVTASVRFSARPLRRRPPHGRSRSPGLLTAGWAPIRSRPAPPRRETGSQQGTNQTRHGDQRHRHPQRSGRHQPGGETPHRTHHRTHHRAAENARRCRIDESQYQQDERTRQRDPAAQQSPLRPKPRGCSPSKRSVIVRLRLRPARLGSGTPHCARRSCTSLFELSPYVR